jgi:hypothetical protein
MKTQLDSTTKANRKKAAANLLIPKIDLRIVTRLLKKIRNLNGKAWLVGGVLTEGYSKRDIDFVITDKRDISKIKKALGSLAPRARFIIKSKPSSPLILEIGNPKV